MASKVFSAGAGQSIDANQPIRVAMIHLAAGSANATVLVKGNGNVRAALSALANSSDDISPQSAPGISALNVEAPVTIDVVGTGAQATVVW